MIANILYFSLGDRSQEIRKIPIEDAFGKAGMKTVYPQNGTENSLCTISNIAILRQRNKLPMLKLL